MKLENKFPPALVFPCSSPTAFAADAPRSRPEQIVTAIGMSGWAASFQEVGIRMGSMHITSALPEADTTSASPIRPPLATATAVLDPDQGNILGTNQRVAPLALTSDESALVGRVPSVVAPRTGEQMARVDAEPDVAGMAYTFPLFQGAIPRDHCSQPVDPDVPHGQRIIGPAISGPWAFGPLPDPAPVRHDGPRFQERDCGVFAPPFPLPVHDVFLTRTNADKQAHA